jgi:L-histidine N-alpha-methyltransferase
MIISGGDRRFELIRKGSGNGLEEMKRDVRAGLTAKQKYLPCKYFYDARGSALFERICGLPEYYQTRTELAILRTAAAEMMDGVSEGYVIELGPGSGGKISILLDAVRNALSRIRYIGVDVCEEALLRAARQVLVRYPALAMSGMVADFHRVKDLLMFPGRKLITFFGGTMGNFSDRESADFLTALSAVMKPGDRLLIGMDLVKQKQVLEAAYNDAQGVTARFNKNILSVLKREMAMPVDVSAFDHMAFYSEREERIEMHLRANRDIAFPGTALGIFFRMKAGETIFTEVSRKFHRNKAEDLAHDAGLHLNRWFTDPREWFAIAEMVPG